MKQPKHIKVPCDKEYPIASGLFTAFSIAGVVAFVVDLIEVINRSF